VTSADATVNFGFDKADLDADAMAAIDTLVNDAKSHGGIRAVRLTGHTDRIGTEEYNLDLSLRRAGSVSDYLIQRGGVDPQVIEIGGKGEAEPLVGCEGERGAAAVSCLAPNRRVDVILDLLGS
jgi:OOP family OmpA-OmpF porin